MSADADEVRRQYAKHCFGLALREDSVVNRVACPTKLTEYLQNDIVPITDFDAIGDFKELGYRSISFLKDLPDENVWEKYVRENKTVLEKFQQRFEEGVKKLKKCI